MITGALIASAVIALMLVALVQGNTKVDKGG
jgi:hypothetical protein